MSISKHRSDVPTDGRSVKQRIDRVGDSSGDQASTLPDSHGLQQLPKKLLKNIADRFPRRSRAALAAAAPRIGLQIRVAGETSFQRLNTPHLDAIAQQLLPRELAACALAAPKVHPFIRPNLKPPGKGKNRDQSQ